MRNKEAVLVEIDNVDGERVEMGIETTFNEKWWKNSHKALILNLRKDHRYKNKMISVYSRMGMTVSVGLGVSHSSFTHYKLEDGKYVKLSKGRKAVEREVIMSIPNTDNCVITKAHVTKLNWVSMHEKLLEDNYGGQVMELVSDFGISTIYPMPKGDWSFEHFNNKGGVATPRRRGIKRKEVQQPQLRLIEDDEVVEDEEVVEEKEPVEIDVEGIREMCGGDEELFEKILATKQMDLREFQKKEWSGRKDKVILGNRLGTPKGTVRVRKIVIG